MEGDNTVDFITPEKKSVSREKSTIDFPYLDQENALEITIGVHAVGGSSCEWDQLAAHLKQAGNGGSFRARMISAKQHGLITYDRGKVALTSLGLRAVDPQQERAAKVESFLQVPLYRAVYDKFKGTTLPPAVALEREMQNLGVPAKQTDKARQAFQRSAKSAGFFEFGADRLVLPPNSQPSVDAPPPPPPANMGNGNGGGENTYHPFIQGLLAKLPEPESEWSIEARAKWLTTAANIFDLMYTAPAESTNTTKYITVQVEQL